MAEAQDVGEENIDAEDFSEPSPEKMAAESAVLLQEGSGLSDDSKFDEACLILQRALAMRVAAFGELDINCAPYYLAYGQSLLKVVQKESNLLGEQKANTSAESKPSADPAESKPSSANPAEPPKKSEPETAAANKDELTDDRQLAWENVEIARVILSRSERPEDQPTLAQCHETCGDIFLENDRYADATSEFLQAAKIHESVSGKGSRRAASDWISAAVSSVFNSKTQEGYAYYMEALSNLDFRLRSLIDQALEEEDEEELVLLDPEVLEDWLEKNKDHKDAEEAKEIWEFCCEISERLEGFSDIENVEANQEDVAKIVEEMLAQEMKKLQQSQEADDEPVNDLGVVKRKSNPSNKRPLDNASEPLAKKTKPDVAKEGN